MFINNMNQMKMTNGFMMPQVGDCNYNLNKDNEGFMNPNMYNQNGSNGYGNMNFYNSYKNMQTEFLFDLSLIEINFYLTIIFYFSF